MPRPESYFLARVVKYDGPLKTPCWIWQRAKDRNGYGRINKRPGESSLAHKACYESLHGPVPTGQELHHRCENTSCINPEHTRPLTRKEHAEVSPKAQQTHCLNGHKFTPENTYIRTQSRKNWLLGRMCKACSLERRRKSRTQKPKAK